MNGTHDALINLVTATTGIETMMSKCKTMANLSETVATLTQQLQKVTALNIMGSGIPEDRQGQANPQVGER